MTNIYHKEIDTVMHTEIVLKEFIENLRSKQIELDKESLNVLRENLWELYD